MAKSEQRVEVTSETDVQLQLGQLRQTLCGGKIHMPDLDSYGQLAVAMWEARANAEKAGKVNAALAKRTVSRADDDKIVTAVANGAGQLIDLSIDERALKYPGRLGMQVTVAIMRARKAAQAGHPVP